jgi:hypothetical protein
VLSEHLKKETKVQEMEAFLADERHTFCSRNGRAGCSSSRTCYDVFETVSNQKMSIRALRLKYFSPNVTKKQRRAILKNELLSMTEVITQNFYL